MCCGIRRAFFVLVVMLPMVARLSSVRAFRYSPTAFVLWRGRNHRINNISLQLLRSASSDDAQDSSFHQKAVVGGLIAEEAGRSDNLFQEWTMDQDKWLWEHQDESIETLASVLGRGLGGVTSRLSKLKDVDSSAYQRLSTGSAKSRDDESRQNTKTKLVPASDILRRFQWDNTLNSQDFSVLHYDRVDDKVIETPLDAPNKSIAGKETRFVDALPEHRIVGIKYKERVVWDREKRLDFVFGNGGIEQVIEEYDEWKRKKDEAQELNRQRRAEVTQRLRQMLGNERFAALKELSNDLTTRTKDDPKVSLKLETEKYVQAALELFRQLHEDPSSSLMPQAIPTSDIEALDALSELVALLPDPPMRQVILLEISVCIKKAKGEKINVPVHRELPQIREEDLTESFIRGSGPGGQKMNKTSSRVLLVHEPTQLRVECQDTRSLQQNRKIARKRLRQKLDEHLYGSQSKASLKAQRASSKKAKAKARSRARQRQKQKANEESAATDLSNEQ